MTEFKLYDGDVPAVSTREFHAHRLRAPHLEQSAHMPRLHLAFAMVADAVDRVQAARADDRVQRAVTVTDLGCGDGGLLSMVKHLPNVAAWGYDFAPANAEGWRERGVEAHEADVFDPSVRLSDMVGAIAITTEVLEHLAHPHTVVRRLFWAGAAWLVASSPWTEHPGSHDACHAWAWDQTGYRDLIEGGGWFVHRHETIGPFQVVLAGRKAPA